MEMNEKVDVWSLGMLLYVVSQGKFLIDSTSPKHFQQIQDIKKELLKNFSRKDGGYSWSKGQLAHMDSDLFTLLDRMLRFNPEDRISMEEVAASEFFSLKEEDKEKLSDEIEEYFGLWSTLDEERFEVFLLELGDIWHDRIKSEGRSL